MIQFWAIGCGASNERSICKDETCETYCRINILEISIPYSTVKK